MEHRDLSGQVLDGRYRVIAPVGKGAMGSVYRAEDVKLGRTVAVKVMNEHVPNEMSTRRRFDREATAMAKLEHPHCASILDVGMHGDQPFVVMDFISGRSLDALVAEGPLPVARAVELTRQILFGLAHAHEHGIIHRDIKPANIVLSQKSGVGDHVKVLDFGLAKLSQETSNLTVGVIVGTPSYMAPEQIRGLALDQRVDVYACGVLLYELLTGTKPFRAPSNEPLAICMAHLNDPVPRLADALPGHDFGALEDVVAHALAKDRDRRFTSATAFANALVAAVPAQPPRPVPVSAPPPPAAPRPSSPAGATVPLADADLAPVRAGSQTIEAPPPSSSEATAPLAPTPVPAGPPRPARKPRRLAIGGAALVLGVGGVLVAVAAGGGDRSPSPSPSSPPVASPVEAAPDAGAEPSTEPPAPAGSLEPPAPPPQDPVAELVARAAELSSARRREAAISLLVKARRTYPRDARLPYHAGLLYLEKMFRTDGLKQLRAAIELDPGYPTDPKLIDAVIRAFNTTAQYDWALASFLRKDIGAAAKPALEDVAKHHRNPIVRSRAAAELRRY